MLLSTFLNKRVFIRGFLKNYNFLVSVVKIFNSANWLEREVWDLYGVFFDSHPDLRRILTDYGFSGFPLRKDFPLVGFIESRYDDELQQVCYEKLSLSQEFRVFKFSATDKNLKKNDFFRSINKNLW